MTNVRTLPVGEDNEEITLALDELAREGARRMIAAALRAEADEYVARYEEEVDEDGHRLVVRNGRARERKVTIGAGTIPVRAPRVNETRVEEETGERKRFSSRILPAYARRSPKVGEVIPILYLRGLSTGDFRPALEGLLGEDAAGLSATTVNGCARNGRPITTGFASGFCPSPATRTCSWTGSTSRSGWARTRRCAC
jgi:putative transposase